MTAMRRTSRNTSGLKSFCEQVEASALKKTRTPTNTLSDPHNMRRCRHDMSAESRRARLEADPWTLPGFVEINRVTCAACLQRIKLDNRNNARYYLAFWQKHKQRCFDWKRDDLLSRRGYSEWEATQIIEDSIIANKKAVKEGRIHFGPDGTPMMGDSKLTPSRRTYGATSTCFLIPLAGASSSSSSISSSAASSLPTSPIPLAADSETTVTLPGLPRRQRKELHLHPDKSAPTPPIRPPQSVTPTSGSPAALNSFNSTQPGSSRQVYTATYFPSRVLPLPFSSHSPVHNMSASRLTLAGPNGFYTPSRHAPGSAWF